MNNITTSPDLRGGSGNCLVKPDRLNGVDKAKSNRMRHRPSICPVWSLQQDAL